MKAIINSIKTIALMLLMTAYTVHDAQAQCTVNFTYTDNGNGVYVFAANGTVTDSSWVTSYDWTFGNQYGYGQTTTVAFTTTDSINVCVNMMAYDPNDSTNYCYISHCQIIAINGSGTTTNTCNPTFTYYDNGSGNYSFNGSSDADSGWVTTYTWYINGMYHFGQNVSYTYLTSATTDYVCLYVSSYDPNDSTQSCSDSYCQYINVNGGTNNCTAYFYMLLDSTGNNVWTAYNSASPAYWYNTLTYTWDFGDGTTSTQAYPTHNYTTPGSYVICLTVQEQDSSGATICTSTWCDSSAYFKTSATIGSLVVKPAQGAAVAKVNETKNDLSVYPNPATTVLNVKMPESTSEYAVYITDIFGRKVTETTINGNENTIDVSGLNTGLYIMELKSADKAEYIRFRKD